METSVGYSLHLHYLTCENTIKQVEDNLTEKFDPQYVSLLLLNGKTVSLCLINNPRRPILSEIHGHVCYLFCVMCGKKRFEEDIFTNSEISDIQMTWIVKNESNNCFTCSNSECMTKKWSKLAKNCPEKMLKSLYLYKRIDDFKNICLIDSHP